MIRVADWTGIVETELFAATYRSYGLASVHHGVEGTFPNCQIPDGRLGLECQA